VFTSLATMTLAEDGLVDLDEPASTYVTRVPVDDRVTVRNLLEHSSGIPNVTDLSGFFQNLHSEQARSWTPEEQMELVADLPLRFNPGMVFHYSNTNYVILGVLLEEVTGRPYHEVLRERIIDPLGMDATYVAGFEEGPEPFDPYLHFGAEYDYTALASVAWSAGGIVSSGPDLHRLFTALFDDKIISSDLRQEMATGDEYGLGVELFDPDLSLIGHSGGIPGYFTFVVHSAETGVTAFLVSTDEQTDFGPAVQAMFEGIASDGGG